MLRQLRRHWYSQQFKGSEFSGLFEKTPSDSFVALDFETTSLNPQQAEIISIGAVKIEKRVIRLSQAFDSYVQAPENLNKDSIKIHQLRHFDLKGGAPLEEQLPKLLKYIGSSPVVGYNIQYDQRILNRYCKAWYNFKLCQPFIDVGQLYADRIKMPQAGMPVNRDLDHICQQLDIPITARHSALADALNAAMIFMRLKYGPRPVHQYE